MKVKLVAKWMYDNRRIIGGIVGSTLMLCGLEDFGTAVTKVTEVI